MVFRSQNEFALTTLHLSDYVTVPEAASDGRVPYTAYWIRKLVREGKVEAVKVGPSAKGQWLVHFPSLLDYIAEMNELGTQKHHPHK